MKKYLLLLLLASCTLNQTKEKGINWHDEAIKDTIPLSPLRTLDLKKVKFEDNFGRIMDSATKIKLIDYSYRKDAWYYKYNKYRDLTYVSKDDYMDKYFSLMINAGDSVTYYLKLIYATKPREVWPGKIKDSTILKKYKK